MLPYIVTIILIISIPASPGLKHKYVSPEPIMFESSEDCIEKTKEKLHVELEKLLEKHPEAIARIGIKCSPIKGEKTNIVY